MKTQEVFIIIEHLDEPSSIVHTVWSKLNLHKYLKKQNIKRAETNFCNIRTVIEILAQKPNARKTG